MKNSDFCFCNFQLVRQLSSCPVDSYLYVGETIENDDDEQKDKWTLVEFHDEFGHLVGFFLITWLVRLIGWWIIEFLIIFFSCWFNCNLCEIVQIAANCEKKEENRPSHSPQDFATYFWPPLFDGQFSYSHLNPCFCHFCFSRAMKFFQLI